MNDSVVSCATSMSFGSGILMQFKACCESHTDRLLGDTIARKTLRFCRIMLESTCEPR